MGLAGLLGTTALVLGALALVAARRRSGSPWTLTAWGLRLGVVLCVALAAIDLHAESPGEVRARVLVVDVSRSLVRARRAVDRLARESLADLEDHDQVALVLLGRRPIVALDWTDAADARAQLEDALSQPVDPWGSDLSAALALAGELIGRAHGSELLLISDGRDTSGAARAAAAALGVPLHVLAPDAPPPAGARLVRLDAPPRVAPGESARVTLEAVALDSTPLTLTLSCGGEPLPPVTRNAVAGEAVRATWITPPLAAGTTLLQGRVEAPRDDAPEDDALEAVVLGGDARRVLRVGARLGLGARATGAGELPRLLAEDPPELLILHEVPERALRPALPALQAALDGGMGLAVVGARRAFGPGGYAGSPLETLLPVTAGPGQERERDLLVAIALDASGSMDGEDESPYLQAVDAALPTDLLRPEDRLALVLFAEAPQLIQPLGPVPPDLRARLEAHTPRGGTDIGAGLVSALQALSVPAEGERRLILATDSEDPDPQRHAVRLRALAESFSGREAHALLIRIGQGPTDALQALAGLLRPALEVEVRRAMDAGDALRELVEGELLAGRAEVREGTFPVALTTQGEARGLKAPTTIPAYAPVRAREDAAYGAEVLARVSDPELDSATRSPPAAVLGRRGLGKTLALPLSGADASPLLAALREVLLPPRRDATLRALREGTLVRAVAEAPGGLPRQVTLRLLSVDGQRTEGLLLPGTPRRHHGALDAPSSRALRAILLDPDGLPLASANIPDTAHGELAETGPDLALLAELSESSGGSMLAAPPSADRPLPSAGGGERSIALAPFAALLALLLLLLDAAAATLRARLSGRRSPLG